MYSKIQNKKVHYEYIKLSKYSPESIKEKQSYWNNWKSKDNPQRLNKNKLITKSKEIIKNEFH